MGVHRHRHPVRDPVHPVHGRGDHRDRGDGDDLPQLPDREPRPSASPPARLAEDEGAVLAREMGPSADGARAPLRRRHVPEHAVATSGDESAPGDRGARTELPLALAEQPAGAVEHARRDRRRRCALLRARPAAQACAPGGTRRRGDGAACSDDDLVVALHV